MASMAKRAVWTATVPTLLALAVVAFAVLEQTSVDSTVSAGWAGSSSIPVWYPPLAVFAIAHTIGLLAVIPGRTARGAIAGAMTVVLAIAFHVVGGPFMVGEVIYGIWIVASLLFLPLFVLLPLAVALAIAVPGALYGLSIYAPLAVARQFAAAGDQTESSGPMRNALIIGGIIVAFVCVAAFGVPSDAARGARGDYYFVQTAVQSAWLVVASVIAVCCAVIALVGQLSYPSTSALAVGSWFTGFAVPIAVIVAAGGPAVSAIESSAALRAIRTAPGLAAASRYFRDGRPRAGDPIRFANGHLRVDRSLVRYQSVDNPQRRITSVALHPPPELRAIGVKDRIILNGWHAEPHRKEVEYRRAVCADSPSRPVVECRLPATGAIVIEIDKEHPERGLYRGATLTSDTGCLIITTGVTGRSFGIRSDFDCSLAEDWPRVAAEIERYITALHVVR
jgi:hypothetical protein